MKTNKAYTKRIKVTKNGKLIGRAKGQNHYNAKESGRTGIKKRRTNAVKFMNARAKNRFLPNA
jgi:ribosomal protein L35